VPKKKTDIQAKVPTQAIEYDGQLYELPIVSTGMELTDEQKAPIMELICKMYATGQHSVKNCCDAVGISTSSFYYWRKNNGEFGQLFVKAAEAGKAGFKELLHEATKRTALKVMNGEFVRELKRTEKIYQQGADGKPILAAMKTVSQEQWLRPSAAFISSMLGLAEPESYSRELMLEERLNGATSSDMKAIIEGLTIYDEPDDNATVKPPLTSEQDAREYGLRLKPPKK
jgi:hypothetical protein